MKDRPLFLLSILLLLAACADGTGDAALQEPTSDCMDPPAGPGALAPRLEATPESLLLTWLEPVDPAMPDTHRFLFAELSGETWSEPVEIASGSTFFANWADVPGVVEDARGERFAHWLEKLGEGTYAYGIPLARATAPGKWERLGLLHDDDSPTEHGFVSYVPLPADAGGGVQAFWLDGRAMAAAGSAVNLGDMGLRTARISAEGPGPSTLLDERTCECCPTAAALTENGPVVVYRDRGANEIRDMAIVRATAEGWSAPRTIHHDGFEIHGCPVNGPAVAARDRRVAVAWWTGAEPARVQVAFSDDAGETFAPPIVLDENGPLGRVDVVLDEEGDAVVSWMAVSSTAESLTASVGETEDSEAEDSEAEIRWQRVAANGERSAPRVLARTSAQRSAGFPEMERRGGDLFFAWVDVAAEEPSRLRLCRDPLP